MGTITQWYNAYNKPDTVKIFARYASLFHKDTTMMTKLEAMSFLTLAYEDKILTPHLRKVVMKVLIKRADIIDQCRITVKYHFQNRMYGISVRYTRDDTIWMAVYIPSKNYHEVYENTSYETIKEVFESFKNYDSIAIRENVLLRHNEIADYF